ncbi:alpha/beta fold hydrolase [Nocardia sp. SYP-A9097]|uniref:alpha/beta fold hydrolase n=1 Tax=Nocardia sp. SYP-A9097 TaxID=2663237 RepID=UPI00129AD289|nr:alpha/beta hydrolase [Nocardia sp. SYP-A9097]MRH92242.1 alpha/beta fold hydrolase [Nocardia sp. SYP-A9097]
MPIASTLAHAAPTHLTVRTEDGVDLAVRAYGPADAELTVVLLHGHCSRAALWTRIRDALLRRYPEARVVCYDHRGHGDSAAASWRTYNLEQLGHDLRDVLDAVAPAGPVVLVGHSMGGMAVLTYIGQNPHEVGTRITGVGLIATAATGLADAGIGRLLCHPVISVFHAAVRCAPTLMHHAKLLAGNVFAPIVRTAEAGHRRIDPRMLTLAIAMHNPTPIVTMSAYLTAFTAYDRTDALAVLSKIPTLILCGTADLMTPPSHSIAMATAIDYADLVLIEGAGHSVIQEQPTRVAAALTRLISRATPATTTPRLALVA